jgi:hypothetical protein
MSLLIENNIPVSLGSGLGLTVDIFQYPYCQGWASLCIYSSILRVRAGPYCAYIPVSLGTGLGLTVQIFQYP